MLVFVYEIVRVGGPGRQCLGPLVLAFAAMTFGKEVMSFAAVESCAMTKLW